MAMGGGGEEGEAVCEINVTPMVDVLLCLLIIFMVASPVTPNEQLQITMPKDSLTKAPTPQADSKLLVTVEPDGTATLGTEALSRDYDAMVKQFENNEKVKTDDKVVITGKPTTPYGEIIRVMTAAHEAGIGEVSVASERL
ncbi:MAG TPA: biopolymer transporter ExbD [Nannocystaceae bacterium]|nr:biopolymer transporter ExbD [Nannocystaceae bacterium]